MGSLNQIKVNVKHTLLNKLLIKKLKRIKKTNFTNSKNTYIVSQKQLSARCHNVITLSSYFYRRKIYRKVIMLSKCWSKKKKNWTPHTVKSVTYGNNKNTLINKLLL